MNHDPAKLSLVSSTIWIIGLVLKRIPSFPDWGIPVFALVAGALLYAGLGPSAHFAQVVENAMWGVAAGATAVGIHTAGKQLAKREP